MRLVLVMMLMMNLVVANSGKIALLIGNSDYSFQPLRNPLHDVDGIYKTLKEIGFDISQKDVLKNASQSQMQKALANFSKRARDAEIALIYFSGHGMQVNNRNYMFPARTTATKPVDLFGLVDLDYFIQSASSAKYGIILVDACRNNPLVKYFQNGKYKGSVAKKGLGQVTPTVGQVVIGFATSAGDTADDGDGDMSPYAKALSVRLKENDDIRNILGKVAKDVSGKYEQNPIYKSNLASSIYLDKGCKDKIILPTYSVREVKILVSEPYKYYIWKDKNGIEHESKPEIIYVAKKLKVIEAFEKKDDRYKVVKELDVIKKAQIPSGVIYKTIHIPGTYITVKIKKMLTPKKIIPCKE